jgi:hypothetical protein
VRAAAQAHGLSLVRVLPVIFAEGRSPYLALYALRRAGMTLPGPEPEPLVIRTANQQRSPAYREARLWMGFPP